MIRAGSKRRKAIPDRVKLLAALRELGLKIDEVAFDHNPALELREWNGADTVPPANDPDHIQLLMVREAKRCNSCGREVKSHREKTFGKKATTAGSDIHKIAKLRRLSKKQAEFRTKLLAKESGGYQAKPKSKWPKRSFNRQKKP